MEAGERFAYSVNGDRFTGSFASRNEALQAAITHARQMPDPPLAVFVGRLVPVLPATRGHAGHVIEHMRERAAAENRRAVEQSLGRITREQAAELDESLSQVIHQWVRRHFEAAASDVEAISEHPVPFPPEMPSPASDEVNEIGESRFPGE
jgi:hypothetical protein